MFLQKFPTTLPIPSKHEYQLDSDQWILRNGFRQKRNAMHTTCYPRSRRTNLFEPGLLQQIASLSFIIQRQKLLITAGPCPLIPSACHPRITHGSCQRDSPHGEGRHRQCAYACRISRSKLSTLAAGSWQLLLASHSPRPQSLCN